MSWTLRLAYCLLPQCAEPCCAETQPATVSIRHHPSPCPVQHLLLGAGQIGQDHDRGACAAAGGCNVTGAGATFGMRGLKPCTCWLGCRGLVRLLRCMHLAQNGSPPVVCNHAFPGHPVGLQERAAVQRVWPELQHAAGALPQGKPPLSMLETICGTAGIECSCIECSCAVLQCCLHDC